MSIDILNHLKMDKATLLRVLNFLSTSFIANMHEVITTSSNRRMMHRFENDILLMDSYSSPARARQRSSFLNHLAILSSCKLKT